MRRLAQFVLFVPTAIAMAIAFLCVELLIGSLSREQNHIGSWLMGARLKLSSADDAVWQWFREDW